MIKGVNWVAVAICVVLLEGLGYLWYGVLLSDVWTAAYTEAMGHAPSMANQAVNMSLGIVNTLILVVGLAWVFARLGVNSLAGIGAAVVVWFFFNFTTMSIDFLYLQLPGRLVIMNMGYQLVSYLIAGAILGLLPAKDTAG
ncbi:DUF1761 domain-containing protein [Phenylobacterium aquaticum]|uniref:DUF1761 domain-containing protein n=1 Tax=Phenylobacterium aquaticum TaxID=1763816 RepID=UPI0026F31291|nr:DUF1761 domain-containing protein [Phenylobacterium aquaticum]